MDELVLVIGEDGVARIHKEPYATVEVDTEEDYRQLQNAVERSNPKRIKINLWDKWMECPVCGNVLRYEDDEVEDFPHFCSHCGQALDWGATDGNQELHNFCCRVSTDDREKLIELLDQNCGYVSEQPAEKLADYLISHGVTVRGKGEWRLENGTYGAIICSNCKHEALLEKNKLSTDLLYAESNFCPNCGAYMQEGKMKNILDLVDFEPAHAHETGRSDNGSGSTGR